jgi:DNA-binding MarR family transcriptional regulator
MAASPMPAGPTDSDLIKIETALFHVRRVWTKPEIVRELRQQGPSGRPVQTSTLLVVDAVAQLSAAGGCTTEPPRPQPSATAPSRTEVAVSEQSRTESVRTEPAHAETSHAETSHAEAARSNPSRAETARTEPARVETAREPGTAGTPHTPADVTVGAVAERLGIDPSTASRLVGHAIDAGFIARRPSPRDARRANLQLTDAGRRLKAVADQFRRAYLAEVLAGWTDAERAEFARLLTRFTDAAVRTP